MEKKRNINIPKFNLDDFFTTQEQRDDNNKEKIESLELSLIDSFPNHHFKVIENDELRKLEESIHDNDILEPLIVRRKENGRFEIISGHRRKKLSNSKKEIKEELGIEVKVGNLIDVEENLFDYDGKKFHELIFIYCIKQSDDSTIFNETLFSGVEEDKNLILNGLIELIY